MDRICPTCESSFVTDNEIKVFCSAKCRTKSHNLKNKKPQPDFIVCETCDCQFTPTSNVGTRQKHCSLKCVKRSYYLKHRETILADLKLNKDKDSLGSPVIEQSECSFCHEKFDLINQAGRQKRFCNSSCKNQFYCDKQKARLKAIRDRTVKLCPICDNSFTPNKTLREIYCSKKCREAVGKNIYKMMQSCYEATSTSKADHSHKILGYTPNQLLEHLQTFPQWARLKHGSWHLDHIYPIVAFTRKGIKDVSLICRLDNLQPLPGARNCSKGDDYDEVAFEAWLSQN